jgi:hypothetical protein
MLHCLIDYIQSSSSCSEHLKFILRSRKRKAQEEEEEEQKKKIQKEWDKNYEVCLNLCV